MDKCEMKTSELDTRHDLSVLPPLLPSAGSSPFHRRFSQLRDQRSAGEEDEDDPWNDRLRAPDFEDVHGFEDDFHLTVIPNFLQDSDAYVAGLEAKLNRVRHTRRQVTAKEMVKALAAESSRLKQDESERDSSESDEYSLFNFWPKIFFPISRRLFPRTALNKSETLPLIKHDVLDEDHSNQISEDSARGEDGSSEQRRRERLDEDQPIVMYERPGASELQIPKEWEDDLARQEEAAQLMAPTGTERSRSALSLSATAAVFPVAEENVSLTGQDKSNDALYHFAYIRASPTSTAESMRVETPIDYHISFVQSSSRFSDRTKKILSPDTSVSSSTSKVQPQRRLSQEQEQTTAFERLSPKSTSSTEEETSQASATLKIKRSTTLSSAPREEAYSSTKESVSAGKTKSEEPFPHSTDDVLPHMSSLVRASIDEEDEIGPTFPLVKSDSESLTSLPKASSSGRCQATADNCEETQESTKPGTESEKSRYSDPHSNIFGESSTELVKEHGSSSLQPVFRMFSSFPQDIHTALQSSIRSWVQQKSVDSSQSQVRDICTASISSLPVAGGTSDIPTKFDGSDRRQYGGTGSELDFQTANTCDSCFGSKVSCKCHCKGKYKAAECVRKKESSGSSVLKYTNQLKSKTSSANSDLNSIPEGCMARKTLSCITDVGSQTTLPSEETTEEQSDEQQVISKLQAGTIGTSSLFKNPQRSVHWFENSAEHSEADTVQHQQNACLSPVSAQGSRTEEQSDFKLDESRPNSTAQASLLPLTTATAQATPTTEVAEEHSAKEDEAALEQGTLPMIIKSFSDEVVSSTVEERAHDDAYLSRSDPCVSPDREKLLQTPNTGEKMTPKIVPTITKDVIPVDESTSQNESSTMRQTTPPLSEAKVPFSSVAATTPFNLTQREASDICDKQKSSTDKNEGHKSASLPDDNANTTRMSPQQDLTLPPETYTEVSGQTSLDGERPPTNETIRGKSPKLDPATSDETTQSSTEATTQEATVLYCQEIVQHSQFTYSSSKDVLQETKKSLTIRKSSNVTRSMRITTTSQFKSMSFRRSNNAFDKPSAGPAQQIPITSSQPESALEHRDSSLPAIRTASCSEINDVAHTRDTTVTGIANRATSLVAVIPEEQVEIPNDAEEEQTLENDLKALEWPAVDQPINYFASRFSLYDISTDASHSEGTLGLLFMQKEFQAQNETTDPDTADTESTREL